MITLFQSDNTFRLDELKSRMLNHIKQLPAIISPIGDCKKIIRYELKCEPIDILSWLHNQSTATKLYWSSRDGHFEMGGVGTSSILKGTSKVSYRSLLQIMEERLSEDNPYLRYYGGINFDDTTLDRSWGNFGTYQFVVPLFEFFHTNNQTVFVFNAQIDRIDQAFIEEAAEQLEQLDFSARTTYRKVPQILNRSDYPDKKGWTNSFNGINIGEQEKIVLARESVFSFDVDLRSDALLKHLKDRTPNCIHFCFQLTNNHAFLGATPERLFKRTGQMIQSEAIAGTRPRVKNQDEDKKLGDQLLHSEKDAREHKYVVDAINKSFARLCVDYKSDHTFKLRKLKGSQHLITQFEGELKDNVNDADILASLHPTPAVAGSPVESAMLTINELEPFKRGWYTGPVGFIGCHETEFAVAIRSGLITGNQLALYAGAGIVKGSTAENEWNEIENKISNFMKVFDQKL